MSVNEFRVWDFSNNTWLPKDEVFKALAYPNCYSNCEANQGFGVADKTKIRLFEGDFAKIERNAENFSTGF